MTQEPYREPYATPPAGEDPLPGYPADEATVAYTTEPTADQASYRSGASASEFDELTYGSGASASDLDQPSYGSDASTTGVAKEQAAQVGQQAAQAGQHVAGVAKHQAANVADEARTQARNLVDQARTEVTSQADSQKQRAAQGLHAVSRDLGSMADSSDQGVAGDLARQLSGAVHELASWLEERDPAALLDEVRSFARRRPGAFLGIALGAGVVAGRLTRGIKDSSGGGPSGGTTGSRPAGGSYGRTAAAPVGGGTSEFPVPTSTGAGGQAGYPAGPAVTEDYPTRPAGAGYPAGSEGALGEGYPSGRGTL